MTLSEWCKKWNVPYQAEQELRAAMGILPPQAGVTVEAGSEKVAQANVRLLAARAGFPLWRNNVGAVKDERGNFFRFGLANDSAKMNDAIKSADLIGIKPVAITSEMVGHTIGQFVSYEIKEQGWTYTGTPREQAQRKWAEMVVSYGGLAKFTTGDL